jgi:SEC-C motif-containing protein
MLPSFEAFLDATPEKGVIVVEYYWQRPNRLTTHAAPGGARTSMVYFKRLLASDKCWCGSKRQFGRCHRRDDDWTFVTLDPDQFAYSPVVLLDHVFGRFDYDSVRSRLAESKELLQIAGESGHTVWVWSLTPPILNDIGTLVLGLLDLSPREFRLETNSEKRFGELTNRVSELLGRSVSAGKTRRAEPQPGLPIAPKKKRK